ncbi:hypothetical protein [Ktedonospora formicarum]|uniref:Uncharacterized protein n=1 Tax=Ktedonospora formicarum TaxID=2778364 RepID=A0A8J3HTP4_9CHLR|nr:hypothetical protein [Ktedonospora formicarum]GHO43086.1 hypothetical protein KSX_12490 [Ktedonospora formicarum]
MKYIGVAILGLGFLIGIIGGSMISFGNGNAALIGALLVPTVGYLVWYFVKRKRGSLPIEERNQQNILTHGHRTGAGNDASGIHLFFVEKFGR